MGMTLQELAQHIGAELRGNGEAVIERCAGIESAGPDEITFLANAFRAQRRGPCCWTRTSSTRTE